MEKPQYKFNLAEFLEHVTREYGDETALKVKESFPDGQMEVEVSKAFSAVDRALEIPEPTPEEMEKERQAFEERARLDEIAQQEWNRMTPKQKAIRYCTVYFGDELAAKLEERFKTRDVASYEEGVQVLYEMLAENSAPPPKFGRMGNQHRLASALA